MWWLGASASFERDFLHAGRVPRVAREDGGSGSLTKNIGQRTDPCERLCIGNFSGLGYEQFGYK